MLNETLVDLMRALTIIALFAGIAAGNVLKNDETVYGKPPTFPSRARFPVLPGGGWDNLRNVEMDRVVNHNYSKNATTDDGRYLIPDDVFTIPIKSSKVKTVAELFNHWDNYTSTLSSGINIEAKLSFPHISIGGKFSSEFESVKETMYNDKTATTRIQARYVRYKTRLSRGVTLSDNFKARAQKIGYMATVNKTDLARYESQLLVRDYGTHVITSLDAGATIVKTDQVLRKFVEQKTSDKRTITASASADFFQVFHFGADYTKKTTQTSVQEYLKQVMSSEVESYGGDMYRPTNFSVNKWVDSVDKDMVAVNVNGDPLSFFINTETLPQLPAGTVSNIRRYVEEAISVYYKHNTYRGCTNPDSNNFNFRSNLDDGTCKPPNTNFTFGGVFQKCSGSGYTNLCTSIEQKNPLTGSTTCPSGYSEVLLNSGTKSTATQQTHCHSCWIFFHCCHTSTVTAHASYSAYWCAADGPVSSNHGMLFGGTFTSTVANPLTQDNSCPLKFYGIKLLRDLTVCVSSDYELGFRYSLPFAGFFSCKAGNPLVLSEDLTEAKLLKSSPTLINFIKASGVGSYPRTCPKGYSQHLVIVDSGCEINYCAKTGSLSPKGLPVIQLPPFMEAPEAEILTMDAADVKIKGEGVEWMAMTQGAPDAPSAQTGGNGQQGEKHSNSAGISAATAGVVGGFIGILLACAIALTVVLLRKRRQRQGSSYNDIN